VRLELLGLSDGGEHRDHHQAAIFLVSITERGTL
jgi:hypothetical protein